MLRDGDARIRNEAATAMLEFNSSQLKHTNHGINLMAEFTAEILSNEIPFSLDSPLELLHGCHQLMLNSTQNDERPIKRMLGKYLFELTNMMFDLKSTEQLVRETHDFFRLISTHMLLK